MAELITSLIMCVDILCAISEQFIRPTDSCLIQTMSATIIAKINWSRYDFSGIENNKRHTIQTLFTHCQNSLNKKNKTNNIVEWKICFRFYTRTYGGSVGLHAELSPSVHHAMRLTVLL